jgi:hypothetical protein
MFGARAIRQQSAALKALASNAGRAASSVLSGEVDRARVATDSFADWVDSQAASRTSPSGIGVENYNWYLKNVQLVPYTWQDEVALMTRELARAHAFLALEEQRNASLPQQVPVASQSEHGTRFNAAVTEYMAFLRDRGLMTIQDYMDPALRAQIGSFVPGPREFFTEVDIAIPR